MTRSGDGTAAAMSASDSELVLLARIADGPVIAATSWNSERLSSSFSGTASITRSAPDTAGCSCDSPRTRPSAAALCSAVTLPLLTPASRFAEIFARPASTRGWRTSNRRVW